MRGLAQVVVEDSHLSPTVPSALESEAYVDGEGSWRACVERGLRTLAGTRRSEAGRIERVRWPRKVLGAGLPTYAVAIQPAFAERLFDTRLAEETLFRRDLSLGLGREQVYYRKPNPGAFMSAPGRILWYVSGGRPGHQVGEIRAISQLAEVVVDGPDVLCRRFERLGVWSFRQVSEVADRNGRVMALRVTDTELLRRPLELPEIQTACEEIGRTFRHPQAPIELDEQVFELHLSSLLRLCRLNSPSSSFRSSLGSQKRFSPVRSRWSFAGCGPQPPVWAPSSSSTLPRRSARSSAPGG